MSREINIRPRSGNVHTHSPGRAPTIAVRTVNLNLWYGSFQALFNVNFEVKAEHITSLIGPSGCGKTTLLRSINRINERFEPKERSRFWGIMPML